MGRVTTDRIERPHRQPPLERQRARALNRDNHLCTIGGPRCTITATQVDHVIPIHLGGTDELHNLSSACHECHAQKTAREAGQARARKGKHTPEPHPGLLP